MGRKEICFLDDDRGKGPGRGGEGRLLGILQKLQVLFCFTAECALMMGALYGRKLNAVILGGLASVQIALWVWLHWKPGERSLGKRKRPGYGREKSVPIGISLWAAAFLALAAVLFRPAAWYEAVYLAEGHVDAMLRGPGSGTGLSSTGRINRGNLYRTGEVKLELAAAQAPAEPLYLRGFSGGDYVGNGWEAADEEALFGEIADILDWKEWIGMIGGMYYSMYFVLNYDMDGEGAERQLHIAHPDGDYSSVYIPYYSRSRWYWRGREGAREEGYECEYYEEKDMGITWEGETRLGEAREWYRSLQGACLEVAEDAYTRVPEELLPRLTAFAEENPREGLEEVTAFIGYALQNMASYTLTPGRPPINEDIVEYFLFDNKEGYCQHFAAAATLLYRLYGIPARYASGYLVQPSDFRFQDGAWRAEVTDMSAHAWTEIFLEDYGWTPVEVTPAADGQMAISYPGLDSNLFRILTERERLGGGAEKSPAGRDREAEGAWDEGYSVFFDMGEHRDFWLVSGSCLFCSVLFCPIVLDERRLRHRDRLWQADCKEIYARMMGLLHDTGYLPDLKGWEREFPERVAEAFPELAKEELCRQQEIVMKDVYGEILPGEEEAQYVRWIYFRVAEAVLGRMKGCRRLLFRYGKGY